MPSFEKRKGCVFFHTILFKILRKLGMFPVGKTKGREKGERCTVQSELVERSGYGFCKNEENANSKDCDKCNPHEIYTNPYCVVQFQHTVTFKETVTR